MAGNDSSQEKTEDATPKRLREARKKGEVPKSKDVSQVLVLIVMLVVMAMTMGTMGSELQSYFKMCFESFGQDVITGAALYDIGKAGLFTLVKILAPILGAGFITGYIAGLVQVGPIFSGEPISFKPERLNPIEHIKQMFKAATFIELLKNMVKLAAVFYIAYTTLSKSLDAVMASSRVHMLLAAQITGGIIFEFLMKVCFVFIFISMFDYVIQRWNFMKKMRMSKDEVKREYKQDEGDPAIKGERRRLHREMAFGDAKQAVKKSDVVVTNPIHVACAIQYDKAEMGAPQLMIKGQRLFAQTIIDYAREEGIPIVRNIPLAWALLNVEEGDEIPEDLYEAVAEVLAYVYEMKQSANNDKPVDPNVYA